MQTVQGSETFEYQQPNTPITTTSMESEESDTSPLKLKNGAKECSTSNAYMERPKKQQNVQQAMLREKLIHAFRLNRKKQLTLERINKYNVKLMEELKTPRVKASNCALMVINYTEQTHDPLIPQVWGYPKKNKFKSLTYNGDDNKQRGRPAQSEGLDEKATNGCCVIM